MGWIDGWTFYPKAKGGSVIHQKPQLNDPDKQNIAELWNDFMMSIEEDRKPVCDILHGYQATNISLLAMISYKLGRSISWDGEKEQIINDAGANQMLARDYRSPWVYPV